MAEVLLCTKQAILAAPNACEYTLTACTHEYNYLNFISFYYCNLDQNVTLISIISIIVVLMAFNLLSTTADRYLAPSLEVIAEKLKMSETIAGVTFLALANGATDVVAGIAAGGKESGGVQIAIGALFGACIFTVTCVLARCIQGADEIHTNRRSFQRDVLFLLIATFYFLFLAILDKITPMLAAGFFIIYVLYFTVVIIQEKMGPGDDDQDNIKLLELGALPDGNKVKSLSLDAVDNFNAQIQRTVSRKMSRVMSIQSHPYSKNNIKGQDSAPQSKNSLEEEEDNTPFGRVMRIYNAPFFFIRDLTMPPFEEERWNYYLTIPTPIFGLLFTIWQLGLVPYFNKEWSLWILYGIAAFSLTLWIIIEGHDENMVKEHSGKFAFVNFIVSSLWLNLLANCFMDFLSLLTVISGLPLNYLSLTMLAWGNSLDDFFIDYYVAKSGHGAMAVTGVYAGQLFNLLIGFGGSMFRQSLRETVHPDIFDFTAHHALANTLTAILLCSLILCLGLTLLVGKLNAWAIGKRMMYFLLIFYVLFFLIVSLISFIWKQEV